MYKLRSAAHEIHDLLLDARLSERNIRGNLIAVPTTH